MYVRFPPRSRLKNRPQLSHHPLGMACPVAGCCRHHAPEVLLPSLKPSDVTALAMALAAPEVRRSANHPRPRSACTSLPRSPPPLPPPRPAAGVGVHIDCVTRGEGEAAAVAAASRRQGGGAPEAGRAGRRRGDHAAAGPGLFSPRREPSHTGRHGQGERTTDRLGQQTTALAVNKRRDPWPAT